MEHEYNELGEEPTPVDLDLILQTVQVAEEAGISPEGILDPNELAVYQDYLADQTMQPNAEHYANLVDSIDQAYLSRLAQDIVNWVSYDENTRSEWLDREALGIKMLGVSDSDLGEPPFEGASMVVHPLLIEAITEFHSRAIAEMWPPDGPVKTTVLGDQTTERIEQAQRVQDYMNYQYTEWMDGAFEEEDAMLFRLPLSGSCFKKIYFDPLTGKLCSRMIEPSDFIVPYSATDLASAPRYTHRYRENHNDVMKKIASGYYAKGRLTELSNELTDKTVVHDEIDHTEGRQYGGQDENVRHTILEMSVYLSVPGYEEQDETGAQSGIELPFIVWVDKDDLTVRRIQRNWGPDDVYKRPELCVTHYRFMPGLGFYGYGLYHLIGGMAQASTGSLRALLDAAAFANMQGGFRTRDSRIRGDADMKIGPGQWKEVDSSAEELAKAFFRMPYEEPSPTLFNLLNYLDERAQKFAGTTGFMDGASNPNAPVGTTLALIEQGQIKFSSIHRRLHVAHRNEFRILARMNALYLPPDGYPYYSNEAEKRIFPADFDERVDVLPISDPTTVSSSQRIIQAQSVLDLAAKYPDKINTGKALDMMLRAMRVSEADELLKPDEALQQANQRSMELDIQLKEAELEKLKAEQSEIALRAMYAAYQCAAIIAQNPSIAPIGDSLYDSAGGIDHNGAPLADISGLPAPATTLPPTDNAAAALDIPQNTSPQFPALPNAQKAPTTGMPDLGKPASPARGVLNGMETPTLSD